MIIAEHAVPGSQGMYRGSRIQLHQEGDRYSVLVISRRGQIEQRHTRIETLDEARKVANGAWVLRRDWNAKDEADAAAKRARMAALPKGTCRRCEGTGHTGHYREQGKCYGCDGTGTRG